jgi:hypothetical protein
MLIFAPLLHGLYPNRRRILRDIADTKDVSWQAQ